MSTSARLYDDERVVLLEGVEDLLLVFFAVVLDTVFFGFTVLASFLAPTEEDRFADVDRLGAGAFFEADVVFVAFADAPLVVFFTPPEAAPDFLVAETDRDLVVLRLAGDFEADFLLDVRVALLLRRSVVFTSVAAGASTASAAAEVSSDFLLPFDDLHTYVFHVSWTNDKG